MIFTKTIYKGVINYMLDIKLENLLKILLPGEYQTAALLGEELKISEKTVRNRLKLLSDILEKNGAEILSKPKIGYCLKVKNSIQFNVFKKNELEDKEINARIPIDSQERINYILAFLINKNDYIKIDEMCDFLYVSRGTLTIDLKKVESILKLYNLRLERRPNYGICIQGKELDKRACLAEYLIKRNNLHIKEFKKIEEELKISETLLKIFEQYKIQINETVFESLVTYINITVNRINKNIFIDSDLKDNKTRQSTLEMVEKITKEIYKNMEKYPKNEILYLALLLEAKIGRGAKRNENIVISSEIDELVLKILKQIYKEFQIDFSNNLEMRMSLNQHMVPMDIRIQYGISLKNPILQEIKKEHSFAYTIAIVAGNVLKEYYKKEISEDEMGYLAMIFALGLEKQNEIISKKNILLVCISGKGSSQFFVYRYKKSFEKYVDKIYNCNIFELDNYDFEGKKIDYIFSTVPIKKEFPVPVYEIDILFKQSDVEKFSKIFEQNGYNFLNKYYREELFIKNCDCKTKEEVIKVLANKASEFVKIEPGFYESVLQREKMAHTDFGNYIAIPHPVTSFSKESFVAVAVLNQPILWEEHQVQVVFLVAISSEVKEDVKLFYQTTTDFLFDEIRIKNLIEAPSYSNLISLLQNKNI